MTQHQAAQRYVRGLRNAAKQRYAAAYLRHLSGGAEPIKPAAVSETGARAIRHQLGKIIG